MLYTVTVNEEGFIASISHTKHDDVNLDLSSIDLEYLNAYKLIEGMAIIDEVKKQEIIAQKEKIAKDERIAELKKYLSDTDYVVSETFEKVMNLNNAVTFIADFIKIMIEFKSKYSTILAARQQAREEIEG